MELSRRPEIERFLKNPGDARAALIHGRDLGLVRERASLLAAAVTARPDDPFDVALLTGEDVADDPARLDAELKAISMMGGRRLVRLRLGADESRAEKAALEALTDHLAGLLNPEAFFLIEAGAVAKGSPLKRAAEKGALCAAIVCWADEPRELSRLTREALAADGVSLDAEALDVFVARLPQERGVARQEIERLALFLGPRSGRVATARDLGDFLGVEPESSLAGAAIDAFGGRLAAAYAGLRRAAQEGEAGPPAVRALGAHLARLRKAAVLSQGGAAPREVARACGVFWKNEREFLRQARVWSGAEIEALQPDILAADLACKQAGPPSPPARLLAERLALTIAAKARRLGL